jgi:cbb3-type cytochrome oxidase maturation protein
MYFPYFMAYMSFGFLISLLVFVWALRNGQFNDQQRARYLPLDEETELGAVEAPGVKRVEAYSLMALACCGLLASAAVLVFSLLRVR